MWYQKRGKKHQSFDTSNFYIDLYNHKMDISQETNFSSDYNVSDDEKSELNMVLLDFMKTISQMHQSIMNDFEKHVSFIIDETTQMYDDWSRVLENMKTDNYNDYYDLDKKSELVHVNHQLFYEFEANYTGLQEHLNDALYQLNELLKHTNIDKEMQSKCKNLCAICLNFDFRLNRSFCDIKILLQKLNAIIPQVKSKVDEFQRRDVEQKAKIRSQQMMIAKTKNKCQKLKLAIERTLRLKHFKRMDIIDEMNRLNTDEPPPKEFNSTLLSDLVKNDKVSKYARRYTEETLDICFVLNSYSPKAYETLLTMLPFPSRETLRKKYGPMVNKEVDNLLNIEQLSFLLDKIRESYDPENDDDAKENVVVSALAFDAAAADPQRTNTGAIFLYQLQPLEHKYPPRPLHISEEQNGKATSKHVQIAKDIATKAESVQIINRYICTDSDSATNDIHKRFEDYMKTCSEKDLKSLVEHAQQYPDLIPISDLLHLIKNLRARIIAHIIKLSPFLNNFDFCQICIDNDVNDDIYKPGQVLAMRDDLALHIFHTDNLKQYFENEIWDAFVFILPYVLIVDVVNSSTLSIQGRLSLLHISYTLINTITSISDGPQLPREKKGKKQNACYITNNQKMRTMNDIVGFAHALTFSPNDIALSRLGTHPVEFKFGEMRDMSYGNNSAKSLTRMAAKADVTKDLLEKNGLTPKHKGRVNFGGAHYTSEWTKDIPPEVDLNEINNEIIKLLHHEVKKEEIPCLQCLVDFLNIESPCPVISLQGELSGTQIYSRNLHYKAKRKSDDDDDND